MTSTPTSDADGDLSRLCRHVREGVRTIVIVALIFLAAGIAWTSVRGPVYEATAYAEIEVPADIATIEQKLRFPSLYEKVAGSDAAGRDLAQATRVKALRDSRLIAVTVRDADPARAAAFANAIVEGFISNAPKMTTAAELRDKIHGINEFADSSNPASPVALLEVLRAHRTSLEQARKADNQAMLELVEKKQSLLESRIREYLEIRRQQFGLPAVEEHEAFDPESALKALIEELDKLFAKRGELDAQARAMEMHGGFDAPAVTVRLVEKAMPPTQPVAPGALIIWLGATVLGGFSGVLLVLLRSA